MCCMDVFAVGMHEDLKIIGAANVMLLLQSPHICLALDIPQAPAAVLKADRLDWTLCMPQNCSGCPAASFELCLLF